MKSQPKKGNGLVIPFPLEKENTVVTDGEGMKPTGEAEEFPEVPFDPEHVGYDTKSDRDGK